MICDKCKRDTVKLWRIENDRRWLCNKCAQTTSRVAALYHLKYCDGNPGHEKIGQVQARYDDNWMLGVEKHGNDTIQVPYQERHARHFVMPAIKGVNA
jgi:hypothetical protein